LVDGLRATRNSILQARANAARPGLTSDSQSSNGVSYAHKPFTSRDRPCPHCLRRQSAHHRASSHSLDRFFGLRRHGDQGRTWNSASQATGQWIHASHHCQKRSREPWRRWIGFGDRDVSGRRIPDWRWLRTEQRRLRDRLQRSECEQWLDGARDSRRRRTVGGHRHRDLHPVSSQDHPPTPQLTALCCQPAAGLAACQINP